MTIKFSDYKQKIIDALYQKSSYLKINEPVTLIDAFINQPIHNELSAALTIGGPTIPSIAVVGNTTGKIYYFALKALLPEMTDMKNELTEPKSMQ